MMRISKKQLLRLHLKAEKLCEAKKPMASNRVYQFILKFYPKDVNALLNLSHNLIEQDKGLYAYPYSKLAYELDREDDMTAVNYSCCLLDTKEIDKAIEILNIEESKGSTNYLVYNNLGFAFQLKANYKLAKEYYEKSITLEDQNPLAYCNLGDVEYFHLNNKELGKNYLLLAEILGDEDAKKSLEKINKTKIE